MRFIGILAIVAMSGCATKGSVQDVTARVSALEAHQAVLESGMSKGLGQVKYIADTAVQTVVEVKEQAAAAARSAQDCEDRASAMFTKTVKK